LHGQALVAAAGNAAQNLHSGAPQATSVRTPPWLQIGGSRVSSLTGALTGCDKSKGTWPAPKTCFASSIAQCAGVSPPARARQAQHRLACTPLSQQRECRTMLVLSRGSPVLRQRGQRWRGDALWSSRSRER
jgi:hypothetical protein